MTHSIGFNASVDSFSAEKTAPSCDRVGAGMLVHQDLNHEALAAWATHGLSRFEFRFRKHWSHLLIHPKTRSRTNPRGSAKVFEGADRGIRRAMKKGAEAREIGQSAGSVRHTAR